MCVCVCVCVCVHMYDCMIVHEAVLGRKQTLFHCLFRMCPCDQSTVSPLNFH